VQHPITHRLLRDPPKARAVVKLPQVDDVEMHAPFRLQTPATQRRLRTKILPLGGKTMPRAQIETSPCLEDNYAFLLHDPETGATACIDVPEAAPIEAVLSDRGWNLSAILITHHHWDHITGVEALAAATGAAIYGCGADAHRLPPLDIALAEGDTFNIGGLQVEVLDVSGHCDNHLAFVVPDAEAAFTADSLMALGCGRLFEGPPQQMLASLQKIAALPPGTWLYSGPDYTPGTGAFATHI